MHTSQTNAHAPRKLLIVDDDKLFGYSVQNEFESKELEITNVQSVFQAHKLCSQNSYDIILLDNNLPDGSGLELVPNILNLNDRAKIILITAFPSFDNAVQALKNGVYDYLSKPVDLNELQLTIERALQTSRLEAVEQVARYQTDQESRQISLIGFRQSPDFLKMVERAAASNASVLITGETGTGKNVIAKYIHYNSSNRTAPFISINCAALPEPLIEAELFGTEKGAFTGANQTRKGIFELADGGTLFLDEIGEMPPTLQAKLLSALEDKQIRRIGGDKARSINVRIIAATNAEPEKRIAEKSFRSDLFYRLSVIRIHLPSLKERSADIDDLCRHFIDYFAPSRKVSVPPDEIDRLLKYDFPGNVRELRNIIERCLILQEGNNIYPSHIINSENKALPNKPAEPDESQNSLIQNGLENKLSLPEIEKQYILAVFASKNKNIAQTAAFLDISLSTLKRKLREYGVR